ncbi:LPXTG cell wall anchor domain-containing protein [Salinicoccus kekensis]|uniref:LPXTG cell wall anchor domain-containing protein n=1 Tax=Salinicoccus kekensis TaxID=714307 RepID=UPI000BE2C268|nr:LPXTG cell wall anchor domain-containing protein [Salinicoccus kekensis]
MPDVEEDVVSAADGSDQADDGSKSSTLPDTGVAALPMGIIASILFAGGALLTFFTRRKQ